MAIFRVVTLQSESQGAPICNLLVETIASTSCQQLQPRGDVFTNVDGSDLERHPHHH